MPNRAIDSDAGKRGALSGARHRRRWPHTVIAGGVRRMRKEQVVALFGIFGKKRQPQSDNVAWASVAGKLAGTLWQVMQSDPKMLASPYARVVLHDDWSVGIATDQRDPSKLLGSRDVSFVLLREDRAALTNWVNELRSNPNPMFQQIATEEYAKRLVRVLMANVEVAD